MITKNTANNSQLVILTRAQYIDRVFIVVALTTGSFKTSTDVNFFKQSSSVTDDSTIFLLVIYRILL